MKKVVLPIYLEEEGCLPKYSSIEAAGADLIAYIDQEIVLPSKQSILIPTGIKVEIPSGYEIQIRPRSGLALKHQLTVLNSPGTIDSDYRGEIKVILINHGNDPFTILPKMRIAQMVVAPVFQAEFVEKLELVHSERGEGGFGHTGLQ